MKKSSSMIVAGVMSGTSADGVDVALCRIRRGLREEPKLTFLAHRGFPYPKRLREEILSAAAGTAHTALELSELSWKLGNVYADCISKTIQHAKIQPTLVAIHGQTISHQTHTRALRSTWQCGEPAVVAERLRLPVVSNFRAADIAAGGQGAPLVPMLDFVHFRSPKVTRILLNLGGIANVTVLPAGCGPESVIAFDTGPANMVIDQLMERLFGKRFDRSGTVSARGTAHEAVLQKLLRLPYFAAAPPKSCGREQFGSAFTESLLKLASKSSPAEIVSTATALTVRTVALAVRNFCIPHAHRFAPHARLEVLAGGGGTANRTLMNMLSAELKHDAVRLRTTHDFGIPTNAKEAAAFALLGWLTWHHRPGNVPAATGATHSTVLGAICWPHGSVDGNHS